MSQREVAITGKNNTKAAVTGQEELLVRVNSIGSSTGLATEITLQSVLLELQGINLDTNGLSQEATQLLVLTALNNILIDTAAILADTANLDVPLSTVATEVTLQAVLTSINNLGLSGLATEPTLQAVLAAIELCCETTNNSLKDIDSALFTLNATASTLATETTLQSVDSNTSTVVTNTTGVARTPGIIRPTAAGNVNSVAATFFSVSVANVGLSNGTVLGATIKPGEVLNFSGDALNNFFTSFAYDATGTEFVIIFVS